MAAERRTMTLLSPSTIRNLKIEQEHLARRRAEMDANLRSIQVILREYPIDESDEPEDE